MNRTCKLFEPLTYWQGATAHRIGNRLIPVGRHLLFIIIIITVTSIRVFCVRVCIVSTHDLTQKATTLTTSHSHVPVHSPPLAAFSHTVPTSPLSLTCIPHSHPFSPHFFSKTVLPVHTLTHFQHSSYTLHYRSSYPSFFDSVLGFIPYFISILCIINCAFLPAVSL
jgi:hypothetical protein